MPQGNPTEGTGTVEEITSADASVTITNPFGPVVDLSVAGATLAGGTQRLTFGWNWVGNPTRAGTITFVSATTGDLLCDLTATGVGATPPRIKPFNAGVYGMTFIWSYNNWNSVVDRSITLRVDGQPFGYSGARCSQETMSNLFPQPSVNCSLTMSVQSSYDNYVQMTIQDGGSNSSPATADGDLTVDVVRIR